MVTESSDRSTKSTSLALADILNYAVVVPRVLCGTNRIPISFQDVSPSLQCRWGDYYA